VLPVHSSRVNAAIVKEAEEQERMDALAKIHDELRNPFWWPLEFFPVVHAYQDENGEWHRSYRYVTQSNFEARRGVQHLI
jgi:hypothetical protein